jgi:hypothetical protein
LGSRSDSGLLIPAGSADIQVTDTIIAGARAPAVLIEGDGRDTVTANIQLQRVTVQDCRGGIAIEGGHSDTARTKEILIKDCSLLGTYDGAALSVKQGDGIDIRDNVIDGGLIGLALGQWGPTEPHGAVTNLRAGGNALRNCDRGIAALASNGGTFANVTLIGNAFTNCRMPLDLSGVPGISVQ